MINVISIKSKSNNRKHLSTSLLLAPHLNTQILSNEPQIVMILKQLKPWQFKRVVTRTVNLPFTAGAEYFTLSFFSLRPLCFLAHRCLPESVAISLSWNTSCRSLTCTIAASLSLQITSGVLASKNMHPINICRTVAYLSQPLIPYLETCLAVHLLARSQPLYPCRLHLVH